MTNATTAMGFAALILTQSTVLKEFGVVASLNILVVFLISLVLIPAYYSVKKAPKERHYNHLEQNWLTGFINFLIHTVMYNRRWVYGSLALLVGLALYGVSLMYTTGSLSEEFKESDVLLKDLRTFERRFGGVVPLEVVIDTRQPRGAYKNSTLKRVERFQRGLDTLPSLSPSLSVVDGLKFAKQAYYRGDPGFYALPTSQERSFIAAYLPEQSQGGGTALLSSLVDSTGRYLRISMQVEDLGKEESFYLQEALQPAWPSTSPPNATISKQPEPGWFFRRVLLTSSAICS
jgi:Predicted exporters of the RND superfamily